MLDLLACPRCGGELQLHDAQLARIGAAAARSAPGSCETCRVGESEGHRAAGIGARVCVQCYQLDVRSGRLACRAGHEFGIENGVPRLAYETAPSQSIQGTYDTAWSSFEYGDTTWSKPTAERVKLFLEEVKLAPHELEGKLMLDAGCGTGVLTHGVRVYGCESVGIDVSAIVFRAQREYESAGGGTHFVQGDLDHAPFREGVFDIVYAGGVLHCNPDPRASFRSIAGKLKPGGRLWVWLYRKRDDLKYRLQQRFRTFVRALPERMQRYVVALWLPQSMARQYFWTLIGLCPAHERLSWRERYLLLLDHYTPEYRWELTEDEVRAWYEQAGFGDLSLTYSEWGFGVIGTKLASVARIVA